MRIKYLCLLFISFFVIACPAEPTYFDDQMHWLEENEIDYERVAIESEASPEFNATIIATSIQKSEKPVLLITHSKGGIDSLEALLRNDDLAKKVKGWIPIQAPFFGSPVADWVIERSNLSTLAFHLLEQLGGTEESLQSLKTDIRIEYLKQNKEKIINLIKTIKIISFTSWKEDEGWDWDTLLEPTRDCMSKKGLRSDGLVPANYAILPNTDFIQISKTDHAVPVMHCMLAQFDRISFTKAILVLLLEKL